MTNFRMLESLRRNPNPTQDDLRGWRFKEVWLDDDTATALAWADERACVFHEALCPHVSTEPWTETGLVAEARALFLAEQTAGSNSYFAFCGHCLIERVPNYGWSPTPRDLELVGNLRERLQDIQNLGGAPIDRAELVKRMNRYGSRDTTLRELDRLIDYFREQHSDEASGLLPLIEQKRHR